MNKNKSKKAYQPRQPYRRDRGQRVRRPAHKSHLPKWLARQPLIMRFNRMTRRRKIVLLGWTGGGALVVIALFTTIFFANSLSSKDKIMNRNKTGVTLVDQNDKVFYEFYNARSDTYVPLGRIAPIVKQATLASEDKDFYSHAGFSPRGIANAVYQNIRPNGLNNGGSTVTQQLVKNSLLSEKRSLLRKYQELILSAEIERRYSKDEILEMYLNSVYFGEGAFGIEDASQVYFNKSAQDLTIAEATLLVGLLPAPSAYSPISGSPEKAETRQDYVLSRMREDGYIDQATEQATDDASLSYSTETLSRDFRAPHFALMVKEELEKKYGEEKIARSGYRVVTTINLDWQTKAENAVSAQVARLARSNVSNGAAVLIDPSNGEIRALVGSHDWEDATNGKLNMTTATRQPGSSFKPLVYASGIENDVFSAASTWEDKATDFGGGYSPKNYDLRYHGTVTTRQSLANSYNIPAVAALQKNGIKDTVTTAQDLGLTTLKDAQSYGLSLALGSGQAKLTEMTNAYATFANQGKYNDLTTITSITNKDGKTIFTHKAKNKSVISDQTAYIMSSMMSDSSARSATFGSSLNLQGQRPAAVKTGTTENYRDAWTIGYTPNLAVGVWIGNNDNAPMSSVAGASGAAPIWRSIMNLTLAGTPVQQFNAPKGLSIRSICRASGALAQNAGDNTMTEYFRPGTLPKTSCNETRAPKASETDVNTNQSSEQSKPVKKKEEKTVTDPPTPNPGEDSEETPPVDQPPQTPTPLINP
jgi:1A family penicillin-binding protein